MLHLAARAGPWVLISGLVVGLGFPAVAGAVRPVIPALVVVLLFLAALRVDLGQWAAARIGLGRAVASVVVLQCGLPLAVAALGLVTGWISADWLVALVIMLSAAAISSSPNMCLMLGRPPEPALRLLILGTALLPLTVLPVFFLVPRLGGVGPVLGAAAILAGTIVVATGAAILVRRAVLPVLSAERRSALDGVSAILLAVFVVGLMEAAADVLLVNPGQMLGWLALAMFANFGLQFGTWAMLGAHWGTDQAVATSLVAGNRNVALFLVSLPVEVLEPLLVFIGCYQIPMYLTPLVMRRFYGGCAG
ncbi:hypothetical protein [Actibacterium sp. 188UL27-1]|uniref:hypothetical protein n=1 Tax=Actibacterium sp. 188UL27-1 TaxID=2786961 RepID=UPI001959A6E6|nr:hypothetical protein [Actibacterium sp. 188UL27-1]MBM7067132.1 hypothetical protein [Actibacterium sp. 188UL27-1]